MYNKVSKKKEGTQMKALVLKLANSYHITVFNESGEIVPGGTRRFCTAEILNAVLDAFDVQEVF